MFDIIADIFTHTDIMVLLILVVGITLIVLEMFNLTIWAYAIVGISLCVVGVAIRAFSAPAEDVIAVFCLMTVMIVFILGIAYFIMIRTVRKGWLDHIPLSMQTDTDRFDYSLLIGKSGTTTSIVAPEGSAIIEGEIYKVHSEGIISEGSQVRVLSIEGSRINVVAY